MKMNCFGLICVVGGLVFALVWLSCWIYEQYLRDHWHLREERCGSVFGVLDTFVRSLLAS